MGETTIHCGNTRLITLDSSSPTPSVTDYNWTSSDYSIATVSTYGTITGISEGTVVITEYNKYNSKLVCSIIITIL